MDNFITINKSKYETMIAQINKILTSYDSSKDKLTFNEALLYMQMGKSVTCDILPDTEIYLHYDQFWITPIGSGLCDTRPYKLTYKQIISNWRLS
jgi:hypothetical protein